MFRHFVNSTSSPSRLTVQFSGNYAVELMSFFAYRKLLPNLINSSWLWWIIRGILANQRRRNIFEWIWMIIVIIIISIIITLQWVNIKKWERGSDGHFHTNHCSWSTRLSQSRSLGFLVWCGRTRSLALRAHSRATRSKARLVSKSIGPSEHRVGAFVYRNAGKVYCVGHVDTSVVRCIWITITDQPQLVRLLWFDLFQSTRCEERNAIFIILQSYCNKMLRGHFWSFLKTLTTGVLSLVFLCNRTLIGFETLQNLLEADGKFAVQKERRSWSYFKNYHNN